VIDVHWLLVDADGAPVAITLEGFVVEPFPGFLAAVVGFVDADDPAGVKG